MSVGMEINPAQKVKNFPLYRSIPGLIRDPLQEIERIGTVAGGEIFRLDFGVFRPYVVTHPDHVQYILKDHPEDFLRDGKFWRPVRRLFGEGIMTQGGKWALSRKVLQPTLTRRHIASIGDQMATIVNDAVDALDEPARSGRPIEVRAELDSLVNKTVLRTFFGDKISMDQNILLAPAFEKIAVAIGLRFLMPFLPLSIPLPGDRVFRQAVQEIDEVVFPLIRENRLRPAHDLDFFGVLCGAVESDGSAVSDQWIRNNLVSMFATATETTAGALTWLWPLLDTHPEVATRLYEEIDRVVGRGPVSVAHGRDLTYTRQVIREVVRLYPVGWVFPRQLVGPQTIGGVTIKGGETVLLSPYLTHRLTEFWDRPEEFDPDRFAGGHKADERRHRYSYFPFGGGPHKCIGEHVFNAEAELMIASILSRFRPVSTTSISKRPKIGATLRPRQKLQVTLRPLT
jgi:cytochrome P450